MDQKADAARLGVELQRRGYGGSIVVPDASGAYLNPFKSDGEASIRQLEAKGFHCYYPRRNPRIRSRADAVNAKFLNANQDSTLFIDPRCENTIKGFKSQRWRWDGKKPYRPKETDNEIDFSHWIDAAGYPVAYLFPSEWLHDARKIKTFVAQ